MGKFFTRFFTRSRICMKFDAIVHLKPSNDRGEFKFDRAKSKNNSTGFK